MLSPTRLLLVSLLLLALGATPAGAASPPKTPKHCKASEAPRKVTYVKPSGGRKHTVKGCSPRAEPAPPATLGAGLLAVLRHSRKSALKLASQRVAKLTRSKAGKRVTAADATTDPLLAASLAPVASHSSKPASAGAHASNVQSGHETFNVTGGPPGTTTTMQRDFVDWDATEARPGSSKEVETETEGTVGGKKSTKKKAMKLSDFTDRCPDAAGVARGEVEFEIRETHTVDGGALETLIVVNTKFKAQFNDNARIASVEVTGETSWSTETRVGERKTSHRSVSATVGLESFGADTGRGERDVRLNFDNITATDQAIAIEGALVGLVGDPTTFAADVMAEALLHLQQRADRCMKIVPEPLEVHVKPGGSVAIGARLTDFDGGPRSGPITTSGGNAGGAVTPSPSEATPLASFTYRALPSRPPGGIDKVDFRHVSKQGRSGVATMTVIYDKPPKPPVTAYAGTFSGTWDSASTGEEWTFDGDARLEYAGEEPPFSAPPGAPAGSYRRFEVSSGGADVEVVAVSPFDGCGFKGSGHLALGPGTVFGYLSVQDVDPPPIAYLLGLQSPSTMTISVTKTGAGPGCDAGEVVSYPVPGIWVAMHTSQSSLSTTLSGAEDASTPESPFDYDVISKWSLVPAG